MASPLGYVIVKYNQASGLPSVESYSGYGGDIYHDRSEAQQDLDCLRAEMAIHRPGERYELADVRLIGESATRSCQELVYKHRPRAWGPSEPGKPCGKPATTVAVWDFGDDVVTELPLCPRHAAALRRSTRTSAPTRWETPVVMHG